MALAPPQDGVFSDAQPTPAELQEMPHSRPSLLGSCLAGNRTEPCAHAWLLWEAETLSPPPTS